MSDIYERMYRHLKAYQDYIKQHHPLAHNSAEVHMNGFVSGWDAATRKALNTEGEG